MVNFRNNNSNRRSSFRRNDRNFKSNGDRQKFNSTFTSNENFKRKSPGRNNHNAPKLIEKYNDLAREALSNGDKILSENYLQHADHFTRVLNEREAYRRDKIKENISENNEGDIDQSVDISSDQSVDISSEENNKKSEEDLDIKKIAKPQLEIN